MDCRIILILRQSIYFISNYIGHTVSYKYDALDQSTSYTYNGAGQIIKSVDKAGNVSYTTYDGMGNITSTTDPEGNINEYEYNKAGQLITKMIADGDCDYSDYTYNALGLKKSVCDGNGYTTNYTYDKAGRITSFTVSGETVSYTYDGNGNITEVKDSNGTVKREYDALNRVSKYTDIYGNVVKYEYDACGNLEKMTYPTGDVGVYTYDANHNMLTSALEGAISKYTTTYTYNKRNQITRVIRPDGSRLTKTYDSTGRLTRTRDTGVAELLAEHRYTYDNMGRIIQETRSAHRGGYIYRMTYDEMSRLTERTEYDQNMTLVKTEAFEYDANGNILTDGDGNGFEYSSGNMIETVNGTYPYYDAAGNLTRIGTNGYGASFRYDTRNRLSSVNSGSSSYVYDAENNRVNMYADSTNTQYAYDTSDGRNRLIWTKDHTGKVTIYGYGAEGLIWSKSGDEYQIYHYDYRGSVCEVTNQNGRLTDTLKYDAYGKVSEHQGENALIFTYNGRDGVLTDPNGLLYMRARYYSPDAKRFISLDIIEGSIADSSTLNRYAYVNGNPISFVDPFGLSAERGQSSSTTSNSIRYSNYQLGGMEMAPSFGPYDNDFPYDPNEKATAEDYANWIIWGAYSFAGGLPVWIKQKMKDPLFKIMPDKVKEFRDKFDKDLSDATEAYNRYRSGTGKSLKIDYEKAYNEAKILKVKLDREISIMQNAVAEFYSSGAGAKFEIIGDLVEIQGELGSENWDKTIGQHNVYGYGVVNIDSSSGDVIMNVTFTMEDMYNFNKGHSDIATGTSDEVNGRFQTLGWAKQFITYGSFSKKVTWTMN